LHDVHATGREPLNVSGAMTMRTAFPSVRNSSAFPLDDRDIPVIY
jgi:hypothetical protein